MIYNSTGLDNAEVGIMPPLKSLCLSGGSLFMVTSKKCKYCGIEKDISNFPISKSCNDGHLHKCYSCINEWRKIRPRVYYECSVESKTCKECGENKTSDKFNKTKDSPDGLISFCKDCMKKRVMVNQKKEDKIIPTHKKCLHCGELKIISDFPVNRANNDNHISMCRKCYAVYCKEIRDRQMKDPNFRYKRNKKQRSSWHQRGDKTIYDKEYMKERRKIHAEKYPEKRKARNFSRCVPRIEGMELHHWSYNMEHSLDMITMTPEFHYKLHSHIFYDQSVFMYRTLAGELLDTKEKHLEYIEKV